jgi:hypothetical protein
MDEIAGSTAVWNSDKQKKETVKKETKSKSWTKPLKQLKKRNFPGFIKPMLATLTSKAFSKEDWILK